MARRVAMPEAPRHQLRAKQHRFEEDGVHNGTFRSVMAKVLTLVNGVALDPGMLKPNRPLLHPCA